MSALPDIRDWYRQEFAGRAPGLAGAGLPWLAAQRRAAIEQFASRGFPTRKEEDWKYTDVAPLALRYFRPVSVAARRRLRRWRRSSSTLGNWCSLTAGLRRRCRISTVCRTAYG